MADVKLHDGREITFNLNAFTLQEYMAIFDDEEKYQELASKLIAKSSDMTADDIQQLGFADNRILFSTFFAKCRDVTKDPNSESASS